MPLLGSRIVHDAGLNCRVGHGDQSGGTRLSASGAREPGVRWAGFRCRGMKPSDHAHIGMSARIADVRAFEAA